MKELSSINQDMDLLEQFQNSKKDKAPNNEYFQPPKPTGWRHKYARNPKPMKLHNIA